MNVVLLRTNAVSPDPRVEKEVNGLLSLEGLSVTIVAWDRNAKYKQNDDYLELSNGKVLIKRMGIPASWGGGMKKNLKSVIEFETKLFIWLLKNRKSYDCIHACDLMTALPAYLPTKLFRKKLVYDIFDYYSDTQSGPKMILNIFKKIEDYLIGKSDVTIICSEKRLEQIKDGKARKVEIIHNSPDISHFDFSINEKNDIPIITYVGNLVEDRCIKLLLNVISKRDDIQLNIGGFGELENYVRDYSAKYSNISFYGKMKYDDVLALENKSDILIALYDPKVPNHKYAAPNKFYEALALGKPLIMLKNTGVDNIISKNGIGSVCDYNEKSLDESISEVLACRNKWDDIGTKMKCIYNGFYSWQIMEQRLKNIYIELMEK